MLGNYMLSQPLHESQKIIEYGKYGDLRLQIELIPSQELIDRFCMWSSQLTVEKPVWIKTKVENLQKGVKREE